MVQPEFSLWLGCKNISVSDAVNINSSCNGAEPVKFKVVRPYYLKNGALCTHPPSY